MIEYFTSYSVLTYRRVSPFFLVSLTRSVAHTLLTRAGERTPLFVQRDFCISNAALGEELADEKGRSVVKVTHQPLPAGFFDDDSEEDSDEEEDEEEFELDEVEGFKATPKKESAKAKVNGDAEDEDEDEEDEEDEEDDEVMDSDDSDFELDSDDGMEQTNVLCSLLAGRVSVITSRSDCILIHALG